MATVVGGLRRLGREALEEGGERVVRRADDAAAFRGIASSGTRKLTGETEAYLGVTKPPGSVTHHLVPKGAYVNRRAKEQLHRAQATLRRHGIGPDDGPNGAFLDPKAHGPIHTNKYFRELDKRLSRARDPKRAREILDDIREEVQNGRFPH